MADGKYAVERAALPGRRTAHGGNDARERVLGDNRGDSGTLACVKNTLEVVQVQGAWCAPGRIDAVVSSVDVSSWMVLWEDETAARQAATQHAQAARLGSWMAYGMQVPPEILKAAMEADGVMMRVSGQMSLVPAKFADALAVVERQGLESARLEALREIVQLATEDHRGARRFAKRARRSLRGAHGVWDPQAGVVILVDARGLEFHGPEAVHPKARATVAAHSRAGIAAKLAEAAPETPAQGAATLHPTLAARPWRITNPS